MTPTWAGPGLFMTMITPSMPIVLPGPFQISSLSRLNKTGTSKVGAISKVQKAQSFFKYAQDVFIKSFENSFETPTVCLSCTI